jgi:septal ring factor EnvC (AmiA/AmiB activator)
MDNLTVITLTLASAIFSGFGVTLFTSIQENKKERIRQHERDQDHLKLDLKDLQIKLYQVERELYEWKDKYYSAIQELIEVKSELEQTLIKLSLIHLEHLDD